MRVNRVRITAAVTLVFAVIVLLFTFRFLSTPSSQPLTVSFVCYTNVNGWKTAAIFKVVNESHLTIMRWSAAYLETAPFRGGVSPTNWLSVPFSYPAVQLKPGDSEYLVIEGLPTDTDWRLNVPWSNGTRASLALFCREYNYAPAFLKFAQEHYASSTPLAATTYLRLAPPSLSE